VIAPCTWLSVHQTGTTAIAESDRIHLLLRSQITPPCRIWRYYWAACRGGQLVQISKFGVDCGARSSRAIPERGIARGRLSRRLPVIR
jgi:hypothetical protein